MYAQYIGVTGNVFHGSLYRLTRKTLLTGIKIEIYNNNNNIKNLSERISTYSEIFYLTEINLLFYIQLKKKIYICMFVWPYKSIPIKSCKI